jgi:hypothetical protein
MNIRKEYIRESSSDESFRGWIAMGMRFPVATLALEAVQRASLERLDSEEALLIQWVTNSRAGRNTARALAAGNRRISKWH